MNDLLLPAVQKSTGPDTDPYYNLVSLHLKGDVNTGRNYNAFSDASSNNFRLTNNGDVRGSSFSPYGTSWSGFFDGASDLITAPNAAATLGAPSGNTNDFTIEGFFFPTGTGIYWSFGTVYSASNYWGISFNRNMSNGANAVGRVAFNLTDSFYIETADGKLIPNQWNHVAAVRTGTTVSLFVNGVREATTTSSIDPNPTGAVEVGRDSVLGRDYLGYVSNVRIVRGATQPYSANSTSITVPTSPLTAITGTSLIACHANRFIDGSSSARTITVYDGARISSFSPFLETDTTTGSGYFDGTGDFLRVPNDASLQLSNANWTIECWVYLTSTSGTQRVISQADSNYEFAFYLASGALTAYSFQSGGTQNFAVSMGTLAAGQWYHIAATRSGSTVRTFVNGAQIGSTTFAGTIDARTSGWNIGASHTPSEYLFGYVADTRIIKGAAVYTGAFTPPTRSLATSGSASAASYPSTTNIDTTFASSATSLLTLQERGAYNTIGFQDESEYQHIITRNGNVAQGTFSPFSPAGWSNRFNGNGDYLRVTNNAALQFGTGDFTVEGWYFIASVVNNNSTLFSIGSYTDGILFRYENASTSTDSLYIAGAPYGWSPLANFPLNRWNHIALVRQSGAVKLYINGTSVLSVTNASNLAQSADTYIARAAHAGTTEDMPGFVSNFRMIKGQAIYTGNFTPPTAPLTTTSVGSSGTNIAASLTGTVGLLTCESNRFIERAGRTISSFGSPSVQPFSPFKSVAYDPAVHGGSGYWDGTTDWLSVASNTAFGFGTGDFTVEGWFYLTADTGTDAMIDFRGASAVAPSIFLYTGNQLAFFYNGAIVYQPSSLTFAMNQWNHVALVRASNVTRFYLNGVAASTTYTDNNNYPTAPCIIGTDSVAGGSNYWNGYISSVRVVKGVAVYTGAFIPPSGPLPILPNTSLLLNFTNGGVIDSTGKNVIETVGNAGVVTTTIKKYGSGSLFFDGTGDSLTVGPNQLLNIGSSDFTIEFWIYPTGSWIGYPLYSTTSRAKSDVLAFEVPTNGSIGVYMTQQGQGAWSLTSGTIGTLTLNAWNHVALVRSGTSIKGYINGVLGGVNVTSSAALAAFDGWNVGTYGGGGYFPGNLDDIRITRGIARYTANFTPPTKALPDRGTLSTLTTDMAAPSSVEALVVGGGGGGARDSTIGVGNGAGGAGGFREFVGGNAIAVSANTNYQLSVGAGGPTQTTSRTNGNDGNNSVFNTITSNGGGGGGTYNNAGRSGGSGGGGGGLSGSAGGPASPSGQGNAGGAGASSGEGGGGGGGAGAVGGTATGRSGANGGNGSASSISGSPVTYAGGGGGGGSTYGGAATGGSGGTGGGGAGGVGSTSGTDGTVNTGGGGGGGGSSASGSIGNGGAGGSGVIIIAYPTSFRPLKASLGLVYTIDTVTRPGYRVYRFTAGTGNISW